jgi:N-acetylglucosamine-6-phosphate deacetylase
VKSVENIFLTGADIILPDRILSGHTLVLEHDRITEIISGPRAVGPTEVHINLQGLVIAPGFVDVHVHGVMGNDVLDGPGAVGRIAGLLPRWGVTAFCPTTVACTPTALETFLREVAELRAAPAGRGARVLPAHLESNFINPGYRGAQPLDCLRSLAGLHDKQTRPHFSGADVLAVIQRCRPDVGIVTLAPEIDGGMRLVQDLVAAGIRVSLGHSAATLEQAQEAIGFGARHATHLFNRMSPMTHRDPGLTGAVLSSGDIAAELICDGHHVHPAVMRVAIAAKGTSKIIAITDGTAGSGLAVGSRARLGGQPITVHEVARLEDGTMAGSVLTMDRAFARLIAGAGADLVEAATMCSTTPARELGLRGHGVIAPGAIADLVVLDATLEVRQTWIAGRRVYSSE